MLTRQRVVLLVTLMMGGAAACRPSDVLSVPPPSGVTVAGTLANQTGAEAAFANAKFQLFGAVVGGFNGVLTWSEFLTDEFTFSGFLTQESPAYVANVDARFTVPAAGFEEGGDPSWQALLNARSLLLLSLPALGQFEPASGQSKVGEAYALVAYAELYLAEDYCDGTPLDQILPAGGVYYGMPLTADSILGIAVGHFDSALAHAAGDAAVEGLASVGMGRVLLDRGQYAAAGAAVTSVPAGFVYNTELAPSFDAGSGVETPNVYTQASTYVQNSRWFNVPDVEGENGLNFRSAHDPRLTFDSSLTTMDGGPWYLPTKFEVNLALLPLATGTEAALIQAEAALEANDVGAWSEALNALRTGAPGSYLALAAPIDTLLSDSTTGASAADRVSVLFRERAFWLFGMGSRLGDLRRLIRQYGRDQSTVFPTGPYANGSQPSLPAPIPNYGTDVNLTLPTLAGLAPTASIITNPNYKGCLASTKTA
jgi:hypothetical protein